LHTCRAALGVGYRRLRCEPGPSAALRRPSLHDALPIWSNPALGLIFGPAFDLATTDGFNSWRSLALGGFLTALGAILTVTRATRDRKSTRLNSSHVSISYAVFCLQKKAAHEG